MTSSLNNPKNLYSAEQLGVGERSQSEALDRSYAPRPVRDGAESLPSFSAAQTQFSGTGESLSVSLDLTASGSDGWSKSDPKFSRDGNGKGSAGKGDGDGVGNGAGQGKVKTPPISYFTVGRDGVWSEDPATANGILDNGETLLSGSQLLDTNGDGFYTIAGIDFSAQDVYVRFVDGKTVAKLDLTGFGAGDKLIFDGRTNQSDYYGLKSDFRFSMPATTSVYAGSYYAGLDGYFQKGVRPNYESSYFQASIYKGVYDTKVNGYYYTGRSRGSRYTDASLVNTLAKGLAFGLSGTYSMESIIPVL